jgi:exonuclease III
MLIGDFNSNKIWDVWDRWWNHSDVVDKLNKMNILSFYHKYYEQEQGEELTPTYFHWKKLEKEFHIDYVFGSEKIYKNLQNMEIGQYDNWIDVSDHMPMILNMNFILKK